MHRVDGNPQNAVPDVRKLGLNVYTEFEVSDKVEFGQVNGFTLVFASANTSPEFPNTVLIVERRRYFGLAYTEDQETTHWYLTDAFWFGEWKKNHGFKEKYHQKLSLPELME
jgi:hypothetical protein